MHVLALWPSSGRLHEDFIKTYTSTSFTINIYLFVIISAVLVKIIVYTEWRTKCHTILCACNTFLLLQKHLTSGTELILIGWKIVPNEEHVQCDHRFASQPLAN